MKIKFFFLSTTTGLLILVSAAMLSLFSQQRDTEVVRTISGDPVYKLLPPDAIPAIMSPEYVAGEEANSQMHADEPVMGLLIDGMPMAYSTWQLDAHEIVNDVVGGVPIAVTW
jgi:hypothetical protein